ncbi:aspartate aminotransferase family protein [Vannielia litorea]|uniref:aspartate aminotransferase family protein n=1 Tax=Vannielia litorea TaxID=1217970 RepID=UPI001BCB6929|nr:aspartate aminotransferase family protein [Vannielia litorea]MBS8225815.1 aspartate aminotransferase family protein [Vannielia litorea]
MNRHSPNSPEARDIAYHLHSYTNAELHQEVGPTVIERGEGVHVYDNQGKRYVEALAGLWSVAVGFGEERLVKAATAQMQKLPYYQTFAHRSHGPAIDLAEKLVSLAPVPMSKAYFTNSGSEANDTVVKFLWYRSNALGKPEKKKIISRLRGYHGVTVASASMTGLPYNHKSFDLPLPQILHTTCPHYWKEGQDGESEEEFATRCAADLDAMIQAEGPDTIAAFIGEPVMGAGGVVVPPAGYWQKIQEVLAKYDILLVADEVICGFGRTGNLWGSQTFDIKPDILVTSKQITSSYFPLSAVLLNERAYAPIQDESGRIGTLGHGVTGAGHPVGAAVALENIAIIEERSLVANAAKQGEPLRAGLKKLADEFGLVGEMRGIGLIAALEMDPTQAKEEKPVGALGAAMNTALLHHGVIARNLGDTIAFCPPMIIDQEGVAEILTGVEKALKDVSTEHG